MPTLEWIGKSKVINHDKEVPFKVLDAQYTFDADGEHRDVAGSENMIIHGDNLLALKALLPKYKGQVKCIYIDPPYNTGNEGWIYNDNVNDPQMKKWLGEVVGKEGEDLSRHDKWLCMMYPRLKLLHELLSEDGVIFISIDDNEQANLKLICDEIFGSRNFITCIPWQSRQSLQNDTDISINHEYIVCYAKLRRAKDRRLKKSNIDTWYDALGFAFYPAKIDDSKFSNPDNDPRGPWKADPFDAPNIRINLTYPIKNPITGEEHLPPRGRHWRTDVHKFASAFNDQRIIFGKNGLGRPQLKVFLSEQQDLGTVPNSWFSAEKYGTATHGTKELQKMFEGQKIFNTPKPTALLCEILKLATKNNDIILDSFAGSGTTAHAVLKMNREDGGNRKFICVEMMDYAETVTAERVKRVIKGYGEGKNAVEGTCGSFTYYELGADLFDEDGNLNDAVGIDKMRQYIWFMETQQPLAPAEEAGSFLGVYHDTAYYFNYDSSAATVLDYKFLQTIQIRASAYVIYADSCLLSEDELVKYNITFKKIPRDIERL